jgi:alpha-amylase/alpha-mannosidase (GH57 family)
MKYLCVHGHFYQPPRENPSLEAIELQDSAYPYHDWNERVTAECYAPNASSRIMGEGNRILKIVNNYARISFDFGPTLLSWLEAKSPDVYRRVLGADKQSAEKYSGHGSAMAQAYNHTIMPLANRRDKYTQVVWGLRDFEHRFGRKPEGMWLPETAVDLETLDIMAQLGIKFTVLAPRQAKRVRRIGGHSWKDVSSDRIDPTRAYRVRLPSRRSIRLFFYDGPISRAVAFEGLLNNGETFSERLLSGYSDSRSWPQLLHIATDGESYGHHHHRGEMALSFALERIENENLARLTNYGEFLQLYPPDHDAEIFENSSWSCVHGIERWRSNCGCNSGGHGDWNQEWRSPLRAALDWLRDCLAPKYEEKARRFLVDPWAARNDYINVILDRSPQSVALFMKEHQRRELSPEEQREVLKLLEIQRHAMLMYTSCGWFFDELSGLETVQVIHYAGRCIWLAQQVFGEDIEPLFLEHLAHAKSNIAEHGDGAHIYNKFVKPAIVDLLKVGGHFAISALFENYDEHARIYCYTVDRKDFERTEVGKITLVVGRAQFTSEITRESSDLSFGVLNMGDHSVSGGIRNFEGDERYHHMRHELEAAFSRADTAEVIHVLDREFGKNIYSLKSLFRDEQRRIVHLILDSTLADAEAVYRRLYDEQLPLMRFLSSGGNPLPKVFYAAAEFALNASLREALGREALDRDRIQRLLNEAKEIKVPLEMQTLEYTLRRRIERVADDLRGDEANLEKLAKLDYFVTFALSLPFEINLWQVQNRCYEDLSTVYREFKPKAEAGDKVARSWTSLFSELCNRLSVQIS